MTDEQIAAAGAAAVEGFPPLTDRQRRTLAAILGPVAEPATEAKPRRTVTPTPPAVEAA